MTKSSETTLRHRQSKLDSGWGRIDTLIPPVSLSEAVAMVHEGSATSIGHAAAVALSERAERRANQSTQAPA